MKHLILPYGEQDPYSEIELIASTTVHSDKFTADQMPALAARVSHAQSGKTGDVESADTKLMRFLADHKHMTPFEHQSATFRVVAPLFVFREWHRHRTQAYNEMSMRYTDDPVGKFFTPENWREQASRDKQSSSGNIPEHAHWKADAVLQGAYEFALKSYEDLQSLGVAREQARIVIPVGNYSEMYATASLRNWFGFWVLRESEHAQYEIRVYANAIDEVLSEIWPTSWGVLKESYKEYK